MSIASHQRQHHHARVDLTNHRESGVNIVKIGGAILTEKAKLKTPNPTEISRFANLVARNRDLGIRTIFIAGGGSFGNAFAHPSFDPASQSLRNLIIEWRDILASAFNRSAAGTTVIVARDLWKRGEGGTFDYSRIADNLMGGKQVVLLGDLIERVGRTTLLSSDLLPLFLSKHVLIERAVMVTNAPGLLYNGQVVRSIRPKEPIPSGALEPSAVPDATGGMRLKIHVMRKLAQRGIAGHICGVGALVDPLDFLSSGPQSGTVFEADRRVSAPC